MIMETIYKINKNNILHSEMSNKRQGCAVVNLEKKNFPGEVVKWVLSLKIESIN
jgi:hypothetical protein